MPRFAANITTMFNELPFMERFKAASKAGFKAVECHFPYEYDALEIKQKLDEAKLELVLFNSPAGKISKGDRGISIFPKRVEEFKTSIDIALNYMHKTGCTKLHILAGLTPQDIDPHDVWGIWIQNMRYAADRLSKFNYSVLCKAQSPKNASGYFLLSQKKVEALVREVGRPNVYVLFNVYHAQLTDGDLTTTIQSISDIIGHVQIASVPARQEPDQGEVFFPYIYEVLSQTGYKGWIGCDYHPKTTTEEGLSWLKPYLERQIENL